MKKSALVVALFATVFVITSATFAQVTLPPGTTFFFYQPIFLFNVTDVTGSIPLGVEAAMDKITVFWNAYFCNEFDKGTCTKTQDREIGVKCYFNCLLQGGLIDSQCANSQKCDFTGFGPGSCTVSNPQYLAKTQNNNKPVNNITCKFYDPSNPTIEFAPYPNRSFYLVSFDTKISSTTAIVGEELSMPIVTTNLGLLGDSYKLKVKAINNPDLVSIQTPDADTEKVNYGKTATVDEKLRILYTTTVRLEIMSKSNTEPTVNFPSACASDTDCSYLMNGVCKCPNLEDNCPSKRCWIRNEVEITAKDASMSEFGLFGFLQIIILAAVTLFFKRL